MLLSSSLRRMLTLAGSIPTFIVGTLVRSVLYSAIIVSCIAFNSCKTRRQRDKEFMRQTMERLNQQLESLQQERDPDKYVLYDSVAKKYGEIFLEQFRSTISACITHIAGLKKRFTQYCGDSAGLAIPLDKETNIDLTNQFFSGNGTGESLYFQLANVKKTMISHNIDDPALDSALREWTGVSEAEGSEKFIELYLHGVPPVAAMTILSKFVNDIDRFEKKILQGILKNNNGTER